MNSMQYLQNGMQGQYRFTNDIFIDTDNTSDENKHIVIHENVHKYLSTLSTVGLLLIMMEKTRIIDGSKKWLFDKLLDSSNKLQEEVATNIEYLSILKNKGIEEYKNKIKELSKNKTYAKYFRSLNIINENIRTEDEAKRAIDVILIIAILSLSINLDIFPLWEFKDEKDFQRYISIENNNVKYNPNKRFKILIKSFFDKKYLQLNYKDIELVDSTTMVSERMSDLCRQTIEKIYKDSNVLDRIKQRVGSIDHRNNIEVDVEDISVLSAYPTDFNTKPVTIKLDFIELDKVIDFLKMDKRAVLRFEHLLGGLEDIAMLSYWSLNKNEVYIGRYNIEDIINIIKEVDNPIVFIQSKLFEQTGRKLLKLFNTKPAYIIMENAIASSLPFIFREFKGSQYTILKDIKYDILLIIKSDVILIQLVVKDLIQDYSGIFNKDKKIKFIDFTDIKFLNEQFIRDISSASFRLNQYMLKNSNNLLK